MKHNLQKIADFFSLGEVNKFLKAGGNANENYFVSTEQGEYVFKIILEQYGVLDKKQEQDFLKRLLEVNFPIVSYLLSKQGEYVYKLGDKIVLVQKKLDAKPPKILNKKIVSQLGKSLANLHLISTKSLPDKKHWLRSDYLQNAVNIGENNFSDKGDILDLLKLYKDIKIDWSIYPKSIVHGDLYLDNTLFKDQNLVAIIDWEEVGLGASILDLGMAITGCCFVDNKFKPELYQSLIKAYQEIRTLTIDELNIIEDAVKYAALTTAIWRLLNNNYYHPEKTFNNRYRLFWEQGFDTWKAPAILPLS